MKTRSSFRSRGLITLMAPNSRGRMVPRLVDVESPIGRMFNQNVTTQRVTITNHLGEVSIYERAA